MRANGSLIAERYRVVKTLGTGGMATVFLAEDERLGRLVAIKRLHADSPDDMRRRLQREARLGASLNHPNLVSVFDVVTYEEGVLVVMEYVEGETLREALDDGSLPPRRAVEVVRGVAAALDHAHENGVVHRDVKPGNVLLGRGGAVKLVDLGIGTATQENTRITRTGTVLGTPAYMAPEQLEGGEVGPAADIYALAALAYECLSGQKARSGRTPVEIAHVAATQPPPDLRDRWRDAPAEAAEVLKRGMDRDPRTRPASAGALAAELDRALGATERTRRFERGAPVTAPTRAQQTRARTPRPEPRDFITSTGARRGAARRWLPAAALIAVGVVALVVALTAGGGSDTGSKRQANRGSAPAKKKKQSQKPAQTQGQPPAQTGASQPGADQGPPVPPQAPPGQADPQRAAALNSQGFQMIQNGDPAGAIPILRQAVALFPKKTTDVDYAYALFNLGDAYLRAGQPDKAIPVLERRLKIPNQTATVQARLDEARSQAGKG